MIRHMLQRGYLMSSQLYVTWSHTDVLVAGMLAALDESLTLVAKTQECGELKSEAGVQNNEPGFARLV
jgi:hypothetical protein